MPQFIFQSVLELPDSPFAAARILVQIEPHWNSLTEALQAAGVACELRAEPIHPKAERPPPVRTRGRPPGSRNRPRPLPRQQEMPVTTSVTETEDAAE
jgi:hypothetical protein